MEPSVPWASCPAMYCLPAGSEAVLTACRETRQPMSAADRKALADWLALEAARIDRGVKPVDRQFVAISRGTLEAIVWGLAGPEDASRNPARCPWCGDNCPRWGLETCPLRPRQVPRPEVP